MTNRTKLILVGVLFVIGMALAGYQFGKSMALRDNRADAAAGLEQ